MPRKCSLAFCKSVDDGSSKCTFFGVPKSSEKTWTDIVSKVNGYDTKVKFVCEKHFKSDDFLTNYAGWPDHKIDDENTHLIQRLKPGLKKGSIPSVFDFKTISVDDQVSVKRSVNDISSLENNDLKCKRQLIWLATDSETDLITNNEQKLNVKEIELPKGWYCHNDEVALTYFCIKNEITDHIKAVVEKQIVINYENHEIKCYIKDQLLTEEFKGISNMTFHQHKSYIQNLVNVMHSKYVCAGGPKSINYPGITAKHAVLSPNNIWRHQKCSLVLESPKPIRCLWCEKILKIFRVYKQRSIVDNCKKSIGPTLSPNRLKTLQILQRTKHRTQKLNSRTKLSG